MNLAPRTLPVNILLAALLLLGTAWLARSDLLWHWNRLIYDWQLRLWTHPVDGEVVIVAIDEASLQALGRWPWPRRVHARLLQRLEQAGARAVGFDILLAEPDRADPQGDALLAQVLTAGERIVMPVVPEEAGAGGQLLEVLPQPDFARHVGLGHVDIDLDRDGLVRSVYLRAGLSEPHWPHLGLAVLQQLAPPEWQSLPGRRNPDLAQASPYSWVRDYQVWLPYAGPAGHFPRVSYAEVLDPDFPLEVLRGRIVLVGMTLPSMDALPTPMAGEGRTMPGVEIIANVVDALRRGATVRPVNEHWQTLIAMLPVLLMLAVHTRSTPRASLFATLVMLPVLALASLLLLRGWHLWLPPAAAMLGVVAAYVLWSWRRLELAVRYLNRELSRLAAETRNSRAAASLPLAESARFLQQVLPVSGVLQLDAGGRPVAHWGAPPTTLAPQSASTDWTQIDDMLWHPLGPSGRKGWLAVRWTGSDPPDTTQYRLLSGLVDSLAPADDRPRRTPHELLQARIGEVQDAQERLRALRQLFDASLARMADGVIVADGLGRVLLANPRAGEYLDQGPSQALSGQPLTALLPCLQVGGTHLWRDVLRQVLLEQSPARLEARTRQGQDLLVYLTPLEEASVSGGLVLTLADITPLKDSERRRRETMDFLSHDMRSPLVSVITLTQIATHFPERVADRDIFGQIRQATAKALELADAFVQLARAEGELTDQIETDLVLLAETALDQVAPQAETKHIRLHREFNVTRALVRGDPGLLERMLVNLLSNAIKYSSEQAEVELGLARDGDQLHCWVADTGHGIAEAEIPRLFDRFKRIARREHAGEKGTGLGLAFVKAVVDRHNGSIRVDSVLNQGTRFSLHFPGVESGS
ncbi:MAG: CHASE2 domain-containing protein [Candidatus Competibacterales bacterium]|nr:CHASE2 domain-containing protein [Candidatus Competibacterales bacterium]